MSQYVIVGENGTGKTLFLRKLVKKLTKKQAVRQVHLDIDMLRNFNCGNRQCFTSRYDEQMFLFLLREYFPNKRIYFNKFGTLKVEFRGKIYNIKTLSHGEKIILNSLLYIFKHKRYSIKQCGYFTVIWDNPELFLSLPLQKRLLMDVMGISGCRNIIIATQSPFIYSCLDMGSVYPIGFWDNIDIGVDFILDTIDIKNGV